MVASFFFHQALFDWGAAGEEATGVAQKTLPTFLQGGLQDFGPFRGSQGWERSRGAALGGCQDFGLHCVFQDLMGGGERKNNPGGIVKKRFAQ